MTAPVRIEARAWGDIRFATLARLLGLAQPSFALIEVAQIWAWQTEHYTPDAPTYVVDEDLVDTVLGPGGAAALVRARLAEELPEGYRIRGSKGRIEWLWKQRQKSQAGGEATRRKHHNKSGPAGQPAAGPEAWLGEGHKPSESHHEDASVASDCSEDYKTGPTGRPCGQPDGQPTGSPQAGPLSLSPEEEDLSRRARAIPPSTIPSTAPSTTYRAQGPLTPEQLAQHREVGKLAESVWARVSASRVAIALELGLTGIIALPVLSPVHEPDAFRELLARIREEGPAARQVCDHVHDVLCADARREGDVEWLGEKAFLKGSWRDARNRSPGTPRRKRDEKPGSRRPAAKRVNTAATTPDDESFLGALRLRPTTEQA